MSDFGLNDAIESGLVKTPRVVIRDDALPNTADYRSRLYHIYVDDDVKDDLNRRGAQEHEPLPDLVSNAYYLLGKDWLETKKWWSHVGFDVPPVMITVANRTETAARIKYAFDHGRIRIEELRAPERTLHIDSKVLEKAEAQEEALTLAGTNGESHDDDSDDKEDIKRPLTKQQQAEQLRQIVDTVGQPGKPGEQIQNVISVGMLSEGWDAKTVTHIMGLRAFSSQLLCEQVVGRGLRRTSYDVGKDGLFTPEYVNIFGVPFTFLPHEEADGPPPPPPAPKTRIEPLPEKSRFQISWPNILRVDHLFRPTLSLDLDAVEPLTLRASDAITVAHLSAILEGKPDLTQWSEIDLNEFAHKFRLQKITFEAARDVYDLMKPTWKASREWLLAQLVRLVEEFLASEHLKLLPDVFNRDPLKRRVLLTLHMNRIVQHLWDAIRFQNTEQLEPVFDPQQPIRSTGDMRTWYTGKPCHPTIKSHINQCVYDSSWEATEAYVLDHSDGIAAWVKKDHLGFEIVYVYNGVVRKYRPDFLICLASGRMLVLEVKGQDTAQNRTKRQALNEWVQAVNTHGEFGRWSYKVSYHPDDVRDILARMSGQDG